MICWKRIKREVLKCVSSENKKKMFLANKNEKEKVAKAPPVLNVCHLKNGAKIVWRGPEFYFKRLQFLDTHS